MKKNTYAAPMLELISVSREDIVRTSVNRLNNDEVTKIPSIAWKN